MRAMWQRHGVHQQNFTPVRPYTLADLRTTLGATFGDTAFANDFFRRYIHGREAPDYVSLLARAGVLVRPARAGTPAIGVPRLNVSDDGAVIVAGPVLVGTTLYRAGAATGDRIVSLDGRPVSSAEGVNAVVTAKRPGDTIEITLEQRGVRRTERVEMGEDRTLEIVLYENAGMAVTEEMRRFRAEWLDSR